MKKIALSLATIAAVCMLAIGATSAYFNNAKTISGNTFATGSVTIGDMSSTHLNVTGLVPGVWTSEYDLDIPYVGSINADLYAGATGTSASSAPQYIADKLLVQIKNKDTNQVVFYNYANFLSTGWTKLASDIGPNSWNHFALQFYLDPSTGNDKQGVSNTDTVFWIYAVQVNGPQPNHIPYGYVFPEE